MIAKKSGPRIVAVASLVLVVLVASLAAQAQTVELTHFAYLSAGQAWFDWLRERAAVFHAQNPDIVVNVQVSASGSYPDQIAVRLAGGAPPDVTELHTGLAAPFIGQGVFLDLRSLIERDPDVDYEDFTPFVWRGLTAPDGSVWGLPTDIYPVTTWFNKDMLAEAGLPTPLDLGDSGWTWAAAEEMASKMTRRRADGTTERYGMDYRLVLRPHIFVTQAGGSFYDRPVQPTESRWNTPEVVAGLSWIRKFLENEWAPPITTPNIAEWYFWNGKTGLDLVDGPGIIGPYLADTSWDWDVAVQPLGPGGRGTEVALDSFQVLADSPHPEAAWKWIKFLAADVESQERFVQVTGRVPSYIPVQPSYPALVPVAPPNWQAFFLAASDPDAFPTYAIPQASQINAVTRDPLNQIWRGEIAVEVAVEEIHRLVQAILAGE